MEISTTTVKVVKEVDELRTTLVLTDQEAVFLKSIIGNINGSSSLPHREFVRDLYRALEKQHKEDVYNKYFSGLLTAK